MQNQTGEGGQKVVTDVSSEYTYLEKLPRIIREEIANAPYDFSVKQIYEDYHSWRMMNFFINSDPYDYLMLMRQNFRGIMHSMTDEEIYFPEYKLTRKQRNVTRKVVQAVHGRVGNTADFRRV